MNKNEKMSFLKGKGAAIGIVVCFMAVLAVVGTYTVGNYKKDMKECPDRYWKMEPIVIRIM